MLKEKKRLNLGKFVRSQMREQGLTDKDMSALTAFSPSTITRCKKNESLSINKVHDILSVLGYELQITEKVEA